MPFIDDQKTLSANKLSRSSLYLTFDSSGSLARLSIPDVVFYDGSLVNSTTYSDLYRVTCRLDSRSHGKSVVAVKRLRIHEKDDIVSLFASELRSWSKLDHPNVLGVIGYAFDSSVYPVVMTKWMENGSAWSYVRSQPDCDLLHLISGIARGLEYLHSENVVHSDLKSDNVLVTSSRDAVICDFGISRLVMSSKSMANFSIGLSGTIRYLAYEILAVSSETINYTSASDVWAFGMTVYELATRERPFQHLTEDEIYSAIIHQELPSFTPHAGSGLMRQEVTRCLRGICRASWNPDEKARIDMRSVLRSLESIQRDNRSGCAQSRPGTEESRYGSKDTFSLLGLWNTLANSISSARRWINRP